MKQVVIVLVLILAVTGYASAQIKNNGVVDVLGAHNVYGRGCIACHAPHSGSAGNGKANVTSTNSGDLALWGEDLTPFYGQTLTFGGGSYTVTVPNYGTAPIALPNGISVAATGLPTRASDGTFVIAACLSCHDGNVAVVGMMKGTAVESVTINGAVIQPPTLLGAQGQAAFNYSNDHPVGPQAVVACGGQYNWDCTVNSNGSISFNGPNSSQFLLNYFDVTASGPISSIVKVAGTAVKNSSGTITGYTSNSWVTCTTCHNQHNMQYFNAGTVTNNGTAPPTVITIGPKPTGFFIRGWYAPGNTATSNSAAQFCRSCHGGESNESAGQMTIATQ